MNELPTDSASEWAKDFDKAMQRNNWTVKDIDEGLMIGWFANAIERAHDARMQRKFTLEEIRGALSRGYCTEENSHKVLDSVLCEAMAVEICQLAGVVPTELTE